MNTPKHAPGIEWINGKLFIDGVPAAQVARHGIQTGLIEPRKPRYFKTAEEAMAYRKRRRRYQTACMAKIRENRWQKSDYEQQLEWLAQHTKARPKAKPARPRPAQATANYLAQLDWLIRRANETGNEHETN